MSHYLVRWFVVLTLFGCISAPAQSQPVKSPTTAPSADFSHTWLLQLPGVGGEMQIDRNLVHGLKDGGWDGPITIYDWTEHDPGMAALLSRKRNEQEAQKVAVMIEERLKDDPHLQITITSHSGGTGIAVWALEKLPADVKVQTLVLLSSALSPDYDLSNALKHVRRQAYVFYSENDTLVLGAGTKMFGTIDGKKTEAAGLVGFTAPAEADRDEYGKLVQKPWVQEWMKYDNAGSHIGFMSRSFAGNVLGPILIEALSQKPGSGPTTHAATTQSAVDSIKHVE